MSPRHTRRDCVVSLKSMLKNNIKLRNLTKKIEIKKQTYLYILLHFLPNDNDGMILKMRDLQKWTQTYVNVLWNER